jgi:hypothetical protein
MANSLITSSIITNTTLAILHNNLGLASTIDRQYDDTFAKSGAKVGSTISIRRPVQYQVRTGNVASLQDINETTTQLTIADPIGIDWAFSDVDLSLSIDKFASRYLEPAGKRLATALDMLVAAKINSVANSTGTPGSFPTTQAGIATLMTNAGAILDDNAAPMDERYMLLNPQSNAKSVASMSTMFNPSDAISKQYRTGMMGTAFGFDFMRSQNIITHTNGTWGTTPLVNGANQGTTVTGTTDNPYASTTSLITDGWTATTGTVTVGDRFTIAGVNAVNLENKQDLGYLKQFTVTSAVTADGSGNMTIVISPAIIAGGAYQNCTALAANNAAITMIGTASATNAQNIAYNKSAFTLATVDMELPGGMDMASRASSDGISLRFVRGYDILNNRRICRFDILYGTTAQRPEWSCVVQG